MMAGRMVVLLLAVALPSVVASNVALSALKPLSLSARVLRPTELEGYGRPEKTLIESARQWTVTSQKLSPAAVAR